MHILRQLSSGRYRIAWRMLFPVLLGLGVWFASRTLWSADTALPAAGLDLQPGTQFAS